MKNWNSFSRMLDQSRAETWIVLVAAWLSGGNDSAVSIIGRVSNRVYFLTSPFCTR